ncbi:TetR/AcrR family transcriptional regulator [Millisia brevis]|uniref:TetR/AcrR family transcriptional regulator n=1 Tax=Millisia brevis TaxID=264148 RepID=UPI00082E45EB|nr:TetR/AcrR family transcriptional regulator [Millisia brevis]
MARRPALTVERIVDAAVAVADRGGLAAVSMRHVGAELGVEAMSLYHHIRGKEALLDLLADWIFAQIELPTIEKPWRAEMVLRAESARAVLSAHSWALGLTESRSNPGPALLRHHDTILGCLRYNGFPVALATSTFSAIDSYVHGFVLTELSVPIETAEDTEQFVETLHLPAQEYPHMAEMFAELVVGARYTYADEFAFGLDLILDALEVRLTAVR